MSPHFHQFHHRHQLHHLWLGLRRSTASLCLVALALTAVVMPKVMAQTLADETGAEARSMDTVTVRTRRSVAERFAATGSRVTIDRQDIEQMGADTAADVLKQLPGVQVTGSGTGRVEIRMRGMDKAATQVLIDGQRQGGGRVSAQLPFDQMPSDMIERIEVLRAPTAEFAGATAGTINIVLRQATVKKETNIRLSNQSVWGQNALQAFVSHTGPFQTAKPEEDASKQTATSTNIGTSTGTDAGNSPSSNIKPAPNLPRMVATNAQPWTYFIAAAASERLTGYDAEKTSSSTSAAGSTSNFSQESSRSRTQEFMLIPRINGYLSAVDQVKLGGHLVGSKTGGGFDSSANGFDTASLPTSALAHENSNSERTWLQARADWSRRFKDSKLDSVLTVQNGRERIDRDRTQSSTTNTGTTNSPNTFGDERRERTTTLSSKLTSTQGELVRMFGFEIEQRHLDVDSLYTATTSTGLNLGADIRRSAIWAQDDWVLPARTTLSLGLRAEQLVSSSDYVSSGSGSAVTQNQVFYQPSAHLRKAIDEQMQVRANLARVTRMPNLLSLIDRTVYSQNNSLSSPDTVGNPGLLPETTLTLDFGIERRLGDAGSTGLNVFGRSQQQVLSNRVSQDSSSGRYISRTENIGDAQIWGLEGDLKHNLAWAGLGPDWSLNGNASWLYSRMSNGEFEGQRIPGQARTLFNATVAKPLRRTGGWFGGGTLSHTGAADLNSQNTSGTVQAFYSLDLYIGRVHPQWGFWRLGVFNLTNSARVQDRVVNGVNSTGQATATTEHAVTTLTPRVYLSVGTQF